VPVVKRHLDVITNSSMSTFRRCQREYELAYIEGYRSVEESDALRFGTLWHAALEALFMGLPMDAAIGRIEDGAKDEFEAAKLRVLLMGYEARWRVQDNGFSELEVLGVEETFQAPLTNPETGAESKSFVRAGKLDVRLSDGFMEHKTTSDDIGLGSIYWRVLTLDSQVSTYYAGARALGTEPRRCIYDVVRKPQLRPKQVPLVDDSGYKIVLDEQGERVYCKVEKKGVGPKPRETGDTKLGYVLQTREETPEEYEARLAEDVAAHPDEYFQRGEVVRLEAELREAEQDAWDVAQQMLEARRRGRYSRNVSSCRRGSGLCWAFDVCCGTASLEDTSRFVRVDNVHQELGELPQAAE
jgi:hypothetical protein